MPIEQGEAEIISAWQMLTRRMGAVCRPQIFDGELPPAAFGNRLDKWVLGGPTEQLALVVFPQFRDEIHKDSGDVRPIRHLREISPNDAS